MANEVQTKEMKAIRTILAALEKLPNDASRARVMQFVDRKETEAPVTPKK